MTSLNFPRPLRRALPREALIAGGALLFSAAAVAGVVHFTPDREPLAAPTAIAPPAMALRPMAPDQAIELNRAIPLVAASGPAASPFALGPANGAARAAALECLAQTIYYEAGQESDAGQRAVAQVVLNRVRHPAFPASVCGVVYEGSTRPTGCQFTFTCDGSLARRPEAAGWNRARRAAAAALNGSVYGPVGNATHYHADYVVPVWAASLAKTDVVGAHLFYRWSGGTGQPGSFAQRYIGREVPAALLRTAALSAHARYVASGTPTAAQDAPAPFAIVRTNGLLVTEQPNGRVRVHFTPQARAAVETAIARPRSVEPDAPSPALLESGAPAADEKALGA